MSAHPPPIPPEQQSPAGGAAASEVADLRKEQQTKDPNLSEQGQSGNRTQNTTNKGFQQNR